MIFSQNSTKTLKYHVPMSQQLFDKNLISSCKNLLLEFQHDQMLTINF